MKVKLFTLVLASTLLTHCGSEHDSSGGNWDDEPKKEDEPAEPAKPAAASTADIGKIKNEQNPAPNGGTTPGALNNENQAAAEAIKAPAPSRKGRPLTTEAFNPNWELSQGDYHAVVEKISQDVATVTIDLKYTVEHKAVKLKRQSSSDEKVSVFKSKALKKDWTSTSSETITFNRDNVSGECYVTYFLDGILQDETVMMRASNCF